MVASPALAVRQQSLPGLCPVTDAVEALATAGGIEERGAIFTRREVVEFILDLCGYTADEKLVNLRLLEPSFGDGDFLIPVVDRLVKAWKRTRSKKSVVDLLGPCIRAVELHRPTFMRTRSALIDHLTAYGVTGTEATMLADTWLVHGDFLLVELEGPFDIVVGNPPYVRQELIPAALLAEYRARYTTVYDRADIYVPFIERSLSSLSAGGRLGFICADRWMKNRYGGPLRELVAQQYHLRAYIDMTDTPAFHADVIAYPAITIIAREPAGPTRVAHRPAVEKATFDELARLMRAKEHPPAEGPVHEVPVVATGTEPWILDSSDQMALLRRLEEHFPVLEETGCKVGIGVATGADKAFIAPFDEIDVEPDRKLPLVMTRDILTGYVEWRGYGVVNPFIDGPGSGLVKLDDYPRLRKYLEARKDEIAKRHVAQKAPANWYRTIDRITASLTEKPKLLIPDIKGEAQIVYEDGKLYPHHNLYYVTADEWDLRALQAVLLSDVARLFVASYSTKMRGGFLRFQAQYLRRIRVPQWKAVSKELRVRLRKAAEALDLKACNNAVFDLYQLTEAERAVLGGSNT